MTRFAALRLPLRSRLLHARCELVVMRILMAFLTGELRKVIGRRKARAGRLARLMAVPAGGGDVRAGQGKARGVMLRQGKGGRSKALHGMAPFAVIVVGRARKLASMDVRVTILAGRPRDLVYRVDHGYGAYPDHAARHRGNVALRAGHIQVPALEGIGGGGVLAYPKAAGFEPLHRVARRAVAAVPPRHELPLVRVRVAVLATVEGQWLAEIRPLVTGVAPNLGVLTQQRVPGSRVVKHRPELDLRNLFPGCGVVAGLTGSLERSVVRIRVAIRALAERDPRKTQQLRIARFRLVTLLAKNPRVRARQREACARVVEARRALPVVGVMAARAVLAELSLMRVLMTGEAVRREAQESPVEVFHLDRRAFRG